MKRINLNVVPWREVALGSVAMQAVSTTVAVIKLRQANKVAEKNAHLVAEVLTVTQNCAEACSDIVDDPDLVPEEVVRRIGSEFNFMMQAVGERLETARELNGDIDVDA
jgi:hypothetical protein